jgi:pyruvate carboxylase
VITKLLVANRGEIAIRAFRAANELGIRSVAMYAYEDRHSLHRQKADESYEIGGRGHPVRAYLDIDAIITLAVEVGADGIYPGYGFLSENPNLAEACAVNGITFVGPPAGVLELAGNKIHALEAARAAGLPVLRDAAPGSDPAALSAAADEVGFPLFVKASAGGGGRGLRRVDTRADLDEAIGAAQREAQSAFGDDSLFLEEAVTSARHIEVQILADATGQTIHLYERDCSVQRRHQKVVEIAPAPNLDPELRARICADAVQFATHIGYVGAGTVEFLVDGSGRHVFIEMNPRIQVEHTVTEEVTSVDLVQAQLRIAGGETLGDIGLRQEAIHVEGSALQCRITAEDPAHDFRPDTGVISTYRTPGGTGIRLDEGTTVGTEVLPYFDSLLAKLTCRGGTFQQATDRARRAVAEFRIRGIATNIPFLQAILDDEDFLAGDLTTDFIEERPQLLTGRQSADRGTRLLTYLAEVTVNRQNGPPPDELEPIEKLPSLDLSVAPERGTRQLLVALGPERFAEHIRQHTELFLTDTTYRDAHQSLLATRLRTYDILESAPYVARMLPGLASLEAWGGATYDVALRFLREDPWERLERLREVVPNICLQMLIRGRNTVGYAPYPDAVGAAFIKEAAETGIDVFRIFDAQNDVNQIRPAVEAVLGTGALAEGALCYTSDLSNPAETLYTLDYYLRLAERLVETGIHVLCVKDMAGLLRAPAAATLVKALRERFDLPVHLHTHDTGGGQLATYLAAIEAGVDWVDGAQAPLSGTTSQPPLSAIVAATNFTPVETGISLDALLDLEPYFESVRRLYGPFETGIAAPTGRVYRHEIPGGQISNLRQQAIALGLGEQIDVVEDLFAKANAILGNIVKVTPTSKVVGDLALHLAAHGVDPTEFAEDPGRFDLPDSVIAFLQGDLGTPPGGWPEPFRSKAISGREDLTTSATLSEEAAAQLAGPNRRAVLSELLFPGPARDYSESVQSYGNLSIVPTSAFFYGLALGEEVEITLTAGASLFFAIDAIGEADDRGFRTLYCRLNGRPRIVAVRDHAVQSTKPSGEKANPDNPTEVGAPFSGVVNIVVKVGDEVEAGQAVATIEAMKMDARVTTTSSGMVQRIVVPNAARVEAGDLLLVLNPGI